MSNFLKEARRRVLGLVRSGPASSTRGWLGLRSLTIFTSVYSVFVYIFKYRKYKAVPFVKKGFSDHRLGVSPSDEVYIKLFKRLQDSYNKAKVDQENIDKPYRVGYMWQDVLDDRFGDLIISLRAKDTVKLQALLENFDRELFSYGLGGATDYYAMKKNPFYKYQFVNTWYKCYNIYREVMDKHPQFTYPMVGNPVGLYYDGQIIPIDAIRYHYYATQILSLLRDVNSPIVCEIGGGLGGQAYKILSNSGRPIKYILLDIPEMLVISSYFLMTALPEKRFLLYGEAPLDCDKLDNYDVILMPNYVLPHLRDEMIDLFFNSASFSEMDSVTVEEYIRQIERICRGYLMHVNHSYKFSWSDRGTESFNMPSTQIQLDPGRFKKIYQYPDLFLLAREEDKIVYRYYYNRSVYYAFLNERLRPVIKE